MDVLCATVRDCPHEVHRAQQTYQLALLQHEHSMDLERGHEPSRRPHRLLGIDSKYSPAHHLAHRVLAELGSREAVKTPVTIERAVEAGTPRRSPPRVKLMGKVPSHLKESRLRGRCIRSQYGYSRCHLGVVWSVVHVCGRRAAIMSGDYSGTTSVKEA